MNLKLTYILISIAFLASSCNSDPIDDKSYTKGSELTFDVANISNLSRGSVTTDIDEFVVYGDAKSTSNGSVTPGVLFNNTKVQYKNGFWQYDGIQFWIQDYEHSFVALSPGAILESGNSSQYLNSKLSFEYSVPASGNVADILTATHRRLYVKNESETSDNNITFTFSHLLSLINIAPAFCDNKLKSDAYMLFHKLEFTGVTTKSRFDILPASRLSSSSTYDMEVDISGKESGDYSITFPTPVKVENNAENVRLFADDDAIITLPQVFSDDSDAEIILYYTTSEDSSMNQINLPLKNLKWESGKSYLYKFIIESSGVIFETCEINPWNLIQEEEITVD